MHRQRCPGSSGHLAAKRHADLTIRTMSVYNDSISKLTSLAPFTYHRSMCLRFSQSFSNLIATFVVLSWTMPWGLSLAPAQLRRSPQDLPHASSKLLQPERLFQSKFEFPTLGGTQYWSDVCVQGGWKIQLNWVSGHYRLIDSEGLRKAAGNLSDCENAMQQNILNGNLQPTRGKVVILLHGLLRSSDTMHQLGQYLKQQGGYEIINLSYASSMGSLESHAGHLAKVIEKLEPEITEIHFVAHSMGNLVVRRYLKELELNHRPADPRFRRMVMLAPPNQGSEKARNLARNTRLFEAIAGPGGLQLGVQWDQLAPKLATPNFEFGILIGAKDEDDNELDQQGIFSRNLTNPRNLTQRMAFEPHDFTVSVEEAKLPGAKDFMTGPYYHWDIKHHPTAMRQTLHFLKAGQFER